MEFDPFVSDLILESSRCGRIIAAFIVTLEFGVFFTNDNKLDRAVPTLYKYIGKIF